MFPGNFLCYTVFLLISCSDYQYDAEGDFANRVRVVNDLSAITGTELSRNHENPDALNQVAKYIKNELYKVCDTVYYQSYLVNDIQYKNVVASLGTIHDKRMVIGAHYDVCGNQDGADDNASGISGLLELARLLSESELQLRIDFVAYTLEEPPFFGTENMGSYIHAKHLFENNILIEGMICLEMIGYFSEEKNSQNYPLKFLRLFFGNRGDFITVVQNFGNGQFGRKFKKQMKQQKIIKTKSFKGPRGIRGLDFSDHRNYLHFGYNAVMVTNTAFYRNPNYHLESDTVETLDITKMLRVIDEIYLVLRDW